MSSELRIMLCILLPSAFLWCASARGSSHPVFSTFIGGGGYEQVRDVAIGTDGSIYITGGTASPDFPTTAGAFDRTLDTSGAKVMDVFVAKLDSAGAIVWSTLLGGPEYDRAYAIEVDSLGYVYVAGRAGAGFPTTPGSVQPDFAGDADMNALYGPQDGFIAKLAPDGAAVEWCTYFGGGDRGFIRDLDIDGDGNVYIVETETSMANPHITPGAVQTVQRGKYDAVVARLSADGRSVEWATYFGGTDNDFFGPSIRVTAEGRVVVSGTVTSPDMQTTSCAFDTTYNGAEDIFIAVLNTTGTELLLGTYLGGSGSDGSETHELAIDRDGSIVVAVNTSSTDFPVAATAFQRTYGGSGGRGTGLHTNYAFDGCIARLSRDGSTLLASTFFGGGAGDGIEGIGTDGEGNIYISGATFSPDFPAGDSSYQRDHRGNGDQFVAVLSPDLSHLLYFSYIGSAEADYGRTLCVDPQGNICVAGETASPGFPVVRAADPAYGGGGKDGTLVRFGPLAKRKTPAPGK